MPKALACVVERPIDAQRIVDELTRSCLCDRADISVMARDESWTPEKATAPVKEAVNAGAEAARATFNAVFQGFDAVSRMMPGGAMLRATGEFGAQLASNGVATAAEIGNALIEAGVPQADAQQYGEAFERGGILITVHPKTENSAQCVRKVIATRGAKAAAVG